MVVSDAIAFAACIVAIVVPYLQHRLDMRRELRLQQRLSYTKAVSELQRMDRLLFNIVSCCPQDEYDNSDLPMLVMSQLDVISELYLLFDSQRFSSRLHSLYLDLDKMYTSGVEEGACYGLSFDTFCAFCDKERVLLPDIAKMYRFPKPISNDDE